MSMLRRIAETIDQDARTPHELMRSLTAKVRRVSWRDLHAVKHRLGASPVISVVMPAHNVESFIADALSSLTTQTFHDFEIIVVDDGSSDRTAAIARRAAIKDWRIKVVSTPNVGPSAARNEGIRHARGELLFFLDADDRCTPDALETLLVCQRHTGSQIVVGGYRRFNESKEWEPAQWINDLHSVTRLRTTLAETPDLLVSAVVWGKLFTRSFWESSGLRFVDGILYEDQLLTSQAYCRADAIDVVPRQLVLWRERTDQSSITQQLRTVRDLVARIGAAERSMEVLREESTPPVVDARLWQLLSHDFPHSLRQIRDNDPEFWATLRETVLPFYEQASDLVLEEVYPQHRVVYELLHDDQREVAVEFIRQTSLSEQRIATTIRDGRVHIDLEKTCPHLRGLPFERKLAAAGEQISPRASIQSVAWQGDTLRIEGWAFLEFVDPEQAATSITANFRSVDRDVDRRIAARVRRTEAPWLTRTHPGSFIDFRSMGMVIEFDVAEIADQVGEWFLELTVESEQYRRSIVPYRYDVVGSASRLRPRVIEGVRVVRPDWHASPFQPLALTLSVEDCAAVVHSVRRHEGHLLVEATPSPAAPGGLLLSPTSRWGLRHSLVPAAYAPDADRRRFAVPYRAPGESQQRHAIVAQGFDRRSQAVVLHQDAQIPEGEALRVDWSADEGLTVSSDPQHIEILAIEVIGTVSFRVTLRSPRQSPARRVVLALSSPKAETRTAVEVTPGDSVTVDVPLRVSRWGRPISPLPLGRYTLHALGETLEGDDVLLNVYTADAVVSRLPYELHDRHDMGLRVLWDPASDAPLLDVHPPHRIDEMGAVQQGRLQRRYQVADRPVQPGSVLLRTYYGESATCNALGLHREIRARGGMGLKVRWAIADHSVAVPSGAEPVIIGSIEWYEALATSELIVENVHQVPYFVKRPGQVIVQTFHGYPFKTMGHDYYRRARFPQHRIDAFDDRMRQWDFIVSPAPYATPLLREEFHYSGAFLEAGYPRNDVLVGEGAERFRKVAREKLNVGDRTAILYAPTWRDYAATGELSAKRVDFVDYDEVAAAVGDEYVLLVRGHQMNARAGSRFGSRGRVVDVTDYPEISELIAASDVAVMDYSSLRFDFAQTGRPMVFLVPDLEEYRRTRGWLLDFEPTAPGPFVGSTEELVEAIVTAEQWVPHFEERYAQFKSAYTPLEDGHAAARVLDALYGYGGPLEGSSDVDNRS